MTHHDAVEGARLLAALDRIKWLLWHCNQYRAPDPIGFFEDSLHHLQHRQPDQL